jgi:hypothetical protein
VRHELLTKDVASIEVTEAASSETQWMLRLWYAAHVSLLAASVTSMDATPLVSSSCLTTGSLVYLNGCYDELLNKGVASIEVTEAASSET